MMGAVPEGWGKYQLQGTIATGATGTVYIAYQPELKRHVAIKELSPSLDQQPNFLNRFRAEARVMTGLESVNCVRVYEFFETDGRAFLVEEFIDGASLRHVIDKVGRLSAEQALGVLKGAMSGLGYAHSQRLLHRDLKPANILVDRDGVSKLANFGQALALSRPEATGGLAEGTPAYMSPEQVQGRATDYRSDIYSAGAVLYELLTGKPPYVADSPAGVMRMHLEAPVPDPRRSNPDIPDDVAFLVGRALTKDPATRQQSATEFFTELDTAAAEGYGSDWHSRSSLKPLVATAMAGAGAVAATPGAAVGGEAGAAATGPAGVGQATPGPATPSTGPVVPPKVHPLRVALGLLLSVLLIVGGLGFGGSKGVLPATLASAAGHAFGDPAKGVSGAGGLAAASRVGVTISALVAGVATLLMTIRGLWRRLRARRLAARGERLPGRVLVPLILYLGVVGGLVALVGSAAVNYLWETPVITLPKF
jgi:tRNA A-37 threonylcarbamoyl transferase component Bud32